VCGASVYYYQNEHGSRVFFDELGPPWPKHPCTDLEVEKRNKRYRQIVVRDKDEIGEILECRKAEGIDASREFRERFKAHPANLFVIRKRLKGRRKSLLVLEAVGARRQRYVYCELYLKKARLGVGDIVAVGREKLSFFNSRKLKDQRCPISRIPSRRAFIQALIDFGDLD
jgi:hypothetical protein